MSASLPVREQHDGDQVANGQAVRGWVPSAICRSHATGKKPRHRLIGGRLVQEASPPKFVEIVAHRVRPRPGDGS